MLTALQLLQSRFNHSLFTEERQLPSLSLLCRCPDYESSLYLLPFFSFSTQTLSAACRCGCLSTNLLLLRYSSRALQVYLSLFTCHASEVVPLMSYPCYDDIRIEAGGGSNVRCRCHRLYQFITALIITIGPFTRMNWHATVSITSGCP